jgi:hypothetical protein
LASRLAITASSATDYLVERSGMKVSSGFLDRTRSLQTITTVAYFWRFCEGEPIALRLTLRKGKYV